MWVSLFCSVIVAMVFFYMAFSYTQKRAQQRYSHNKESAPSIPVFKLLSKVLFLFSMFATVLSYWLELPEFLLFHDSDNFRIVGALIVLIACIGLHHSFATLDQNYSPLFDAYKPFNLIQTGIYSFIRHPIYAFNLCVSFGLALSSGVILVAISAFIGFGFVIRAIFIEEAYLTRHFDDYANYSTKTWRLIPFIF